MKGVFIEKQKFTQWWLWLPFGGLAIFAICAIVQQLVLKRTVGDNPMTDGGIIGFTLFVIGITYFIYSIELRTRIDENGIHLHFYPFFKSSYLWTSIMKVDFILYGFVGFGIRIVGRHGTVYNIKGNRGMAIQLKDGSKFLIGTQESEKIKAFATKYHKQTQIQ